MSLDIPKLHPEFIAEVVQRENMPRLDPFDPKTRNLDLFAVTIKIMRHLDWDYQKVIAVIESGDLPEEVGEAILYVLGDSSRSLATSCINTYFDAASRQKNFIVNDIFFNAFKNISAENLRFRDIDSPINAYCHFPKMSLIDEDGDVYQDAYIYVGPEKDFPCRILKEEGNPPFEASESIISIAVISQKNCFTLNSYLPAERDLSLIEGLRGVPHIKKDDVRKYEESELDSIPMVCAQVMKLLAYIGTAEADLRDFRNDLRFRGNSTTKPINKDRWKSLLTYKLIGFDFKSEISYDSKAWHVRDFMRWQRYGVGNQFVKLKLIKAHSRSRKTVGRDICAAES